jgi:hypothetical protein
MSRNNVRSLKLPTPDSNNNGNNQSFDNDLSKLLEKEHFGEYSYGRSFPSKGVFSVSIPDPIEPRAKFVYNYFTPNERAFIETDPKGIIYDSTAFNVNDANFIATTEKSPRYIKLDFKPPKSQKDNLEDYLNTSGTTSDNINNLINNFDEEDYFLGSFKDLGTDVSLKDIMEKLTIEGASSNFNFSGVEIIDTFADKKIYEMLNSSITFQEISTTLDSPRDRAVAFKNLISNNEVGLPNPTGLQKLSLVEILSETQPGGVSFAPNDVSKETSELATNSITKQSFSTKFNNLFFNDIISHNTLTMNTIYEDEIRGLESISQNAQQIAIENASPDAVMDHDHHLNIEPLKITPIEISNNDISNLIEKLEEKKALIIAEIENSLVESNEAFTSNMHLIYEAINSALVNPIDFLVRKRNIPSIKVIGYLIQKSEILQDETTKTFPNLFIDNPKDFSTFIDKEVRYGAVYNYKIRSIAQVKSCISVVRKHNNAKEVMIADYVILSDGTSISARCVENVPPPEPVRINAFIDFKYRAPVITWEFPLNKQRDIKRFQIFKRKTINEPFVLMAEYDFDNSIYRTQPNEIAKSDNIFKLNIPYKRYRDREFNLNFDSAIYAIAAVDAHGLSSGYSSQIKIKYDKYTNRLVKDIVSFKSAPKPYPNLYIDEDFFKDIITSSGKKRCNVYFDPEYYKLYKKVKKENDNVEHEDLEYIRTSDTDYNYTFQMINIDLQEQQEIKIKIADRSGRQIDVPAAKISPSNLSFEFGVVKD